MVIHSESFTYADNTTVQSFTPAWEQTQNSLGHCQAASNTLTRANTNQSGFAWYGTADTNSGNVKVTVTRRAGSLSSQRGFYALMRVKIAHNATVSTLNGYAVGCDVNGRFVNFHKYLNGAASAVGAAPSQLPVGTFNGTDAYQVIATCLTVGSDVVLSASVRNSTNGQWLQTDGTWGNTQAVYRTVTDTAPAAEFVGAGKHGVTFTMNVNNQPTIDDWTLETHSADSTAPTAPANLRAHFGDTRVGLAWDASTDAVGVTSYTVHRSTDGSSFSPAQTAVTTTYWADTGRTNGTTYYYRVTALDAAANESSESNTVSGTPQVRSSVSATSLYPTDTWNGTANSGGTPPTDPARTTFKPIVRLLTVPYQDVTGNLDILVGAFARDTDNDLVDLSGVTFWLEGNTVTVTNRQVYTGYGDEPIEGYVVTLNGANFPAGIHGAVNLYVTATPEDGTGQSRVIGPFTFYANMIEALPSAEVYVDATLGNDTTGIGSSASPFASIDKAKESLRGRDEVSGGRIKVRSGSYTVTTSTSLNGTSVSNDRFLTIEPDDGASVTLTGAGPDDLAVSKLKVTGIDANLSTSGATAAVPGGTSVTWVEGMSYVGPGRLVQGSTVISGTSETYLTETAMQSCGQGQSGRLVRNVTVTDIASDAFSGSSAVVSCTVGTINKSGTSGWVGGEAHPDLWQFLSNSENLLFYRVRASVSAEAQQIFFKDYEFKDVAIVDCDLNGGGGFISQLGSSSTGVTSTFSHFVIRNLTLLNQGFFSRSSSETDAYSYMEIKRCIFYVNGINANAQHGVNNCIWDRNAFNGGSTHGTNAIASPLDWDSTTRIPADGGNLQPGIARHTLLDAAGNPRSETDAAIGAYATVTEYDASGEASSSSSDSSLSSSSSESSVEFSSFSSSSFSSASSDNSSSDIAFGLSTPTIMSVTTYNGGFLGGVIIKYQAFGIEADHLERDALVRLYVDGEDAGLGAAQEDGTVRFMTVVLPLGWTNLSIRQELDGEVSEVSPEFAVRVNTAENTGLSIAAPKIIPDGGTFTNWPVTVTITSDVPGTIYYVVDGTGYSQPTIKYKGPFKLYQTAVVKAKMKFNRVKSFTPVESAVVKRTIRIVR